MDFLDEVVIDVVSGDGGRGCVSFRREKFISKGGPDGGNGGEGGSIIIRATGKSFTLTDYISRRYFKAKNGEPGRGKKQSGKNGADIVLDVPIGTVIQDNDTGEILADLTHEGQEILLAQGGIGGKGNKHFASSTNRAPRMAQPGCPGQDKKLNLSLKFLADIGLIGFPNAGKSTLLSRITSATPRVDSYPFTTIFPNLGVMTFDDESFLVIADIPGLIEGAGLGRGLGHRFLKHIERTRLLLHLIDITYEPEQDILEDYNTIRSEMRVYNPSLIDKPQMVLINKIDLHDTRRRDLDELQEAFKAIGVESFPVSALTGEGLAELKKNIFKKWVEGRDEQPDSPI